ENFRAFHLLVAAEAERHAGGAAGELYEAAIAAARDMESPQHEALASDRCAAFWLGRKNATVASAYLAEARRCYQAWGAAALARPAGRAAQPIDLASVTKAAHALSVEIVLDELLRKLVRIALENAGAP